MIPVMAIAVALPFLAAVVGMLLGHQVSRALVFGRPVGGGTTVPAGGGLVPGEGEAVPGEGKAGENSHSVWGPVPWRSGPALIAVVPMAIATVLTAIVATVQWLDPEVREGTLTVVQTGTIPIGISLSVDGLSALVAFMVCCVALAVQVYSVAYLRGDARYSSYAAFVSLFTSAMLLVVVAGDLLVLYVGWEIMGVCSYFLIGHHWEDRANSRAAVKAFLVTRVGDVGFLFGIFVLGIGAGTFAVSGVLDADLPDGVVLVGTLLLLAGVAGKSAQFPLHTWLPDAMAGPTPISALIHAATMVAAGVYVVARLYPAFLAAPATLAVLGVMAAISMLGAALAALAQRDLKRVLAYSTISQLAVMAAGLAVGTRNGAIFHLLTHGAFKALLFLAAGCVIVVVGSNMLGDMGGLRMGMPITFWSMTIGFAALAGIFPASGFFSKESIITAAEHAVGAENLPPVVAWLLLIALLLTVAVTAAYAMRAWLMTFFGEARSAVAAREAPPLMRWPVAVLAVPSLVLGLFGLGAAELRPTWSSTLLSVLFAAAGAGLAFVVWNADPALDPARRLGRAGSVFERAFLVDELYDRGIVRPVRALAGGVVRADDRVVDAAVEASGRSAGRLGGLLRVPHNGNPQAYVTGVLAGVAVIVVAVVVLS